MTYTIAGADLVPFITGASNNEFNMINKSLRWIQIFNDGRYSLEQKMEMV